MSLHAGVRGSTQASGKTNGELVKRFVGYSSTSGAELERIVKGALAAGPVAQQTK